MRRHRRGEGHQLGGCCCIAGENWWHLNWGGICAIGEKGIRYLGGRIHETWILIGCGKECDRSWSLQPTARHTEVLRNVSSLRCVPL